MQINTPSLEEHPDLSVDDILTNMAVKTDLIANDRVLFASKWWDYRFMTPFEATMSYIDTFGIEARKIYARDIDYERAQHISVVTGESVREALLKNSDKAKRAINGFWRGRQVADALGMPYETYIAEALNNRMRFWGTIKVQDKKGRWQTKLPKANHLYAERDVIKIEARWTELQASRVFYAKHHAYMAQNYCGAPAQDAYCAYLVDRARRSTDMIAQLSDMIEDDKLPVQYIEANLEAGICEKVFASQR